MKDKILYDSNGVPAFRVKNDVWEVLVPTGVHQWLKENNKEFTADGKVIDKKKKRNI